MTDASTSRTAADAVTTGSGASDTTPGTVGGQRKNDPLKEVRHTRVSALWVGMIAASVVLIALLVFILQNSQKVTVSFLSFDASIPLAVALLLAAVAGVLLVAIPGVARIVQLRRAVRKNR